MRADWQPTRLKKVLRQVRRLETVQPTKAYDLLGVRLEGAGPYLRETKTGDQISANQLAQVAAGDFIYSRLFAWRGAFGTIGQDLDGAFVSGEFPTFVADTENIDIEFLRLWFLLPTTIQVVESLSSGSTPLTRNRFKEHHFLDLEILLPPLAEQQRIVARIDALAARIEEAKGLRVQAVAEVEAVMGAAQSHVFLDSHYQTVHLEDVCLSIVDCLHSNPVFSDEGVPTVRSPDVRWGTLDIENARRTSEEEFVRRTCRGAPQVDDIIFVREGGGVGKAGIVLKGQRFSLGQRTMMLRPDKSKVLPRFFLHQLLSPLVFKEQILVRLKGSASPHLNINALRRFSVLLPTLPEQHRILAYLDNLQTKVDAVKRLQAEIQAELDALLPSVLDRAFRGEL